MLLQFIQAVVSVLQGGLPETTLKSADVIIGAGKAVFEGYVSDGKRRKQKVGTTLVEPFLQNVLLGGHSRCIPHGLGEGSTIGLEHMAKSLYRYGALHVLADITNHRVYFPVPLPVKSTFGQAHDGNELRAGMTRPHGVGFMSLYKLFRQGETVSEGGMDINGKRQDTAISLVSLQKQMKISLPR